MQSSAFAPRLMTARSWLPPSSRRSAFGRKRTDRRSSSSRPIPIRSTCRITSRRRFTVPGLTPSIHPITSGYPSYIGAGVIAAGLAFGAGWAIGRWGNYWGGGCNWGNRNVYVNHRTNNVNWQHNSAHRGGVKYANQNVANRFGGNVGNKAGVSDRMDFRGRD